MAQPRASDRHAEQRPALSVDIVRVFDAPRMLVYQMWSTPNNLAKWSAPRGYAIPAARTDFREGGSWYARMLALDGADHRLQGRYVEIIEGSRIVLTHAWLDEKGKPGHETLITISFEDEGKKTKMTFRQEGFESVVSRDGMASGWKECFDQLGEQLAHIAGPPERSRS
ncbi:MAG: SRPBCC domain-containing protein [Hyphomicrobium sp.]|uniref:SRPBCC family protein n=1 Tax=Hyphomicrobium sp. TaxID=82 RepID=UPI0035624249